MPALGMLGVTEGLFVLLQNGVMAWRGSDMGAERVRSSGGDKLRDRKKAEARGG